MSKKPVRRATPSKKNVKSMREAANALVLTLQVEQMTYEFEADLFDLDNLNIGVLNEQLSKIPGSIAYVGIVYSEIEETLSRKQTEFDVWKAQQIVKYFGDSKIFKSEIDKLNNLRVKFYDTYLAFENEIADLKKIARILKVYEKGLDAKLQLAQTLSANLRAEREAFVKDSGIQGSLGA